MKKSVIMIIVILAMLFSITLIAIAATTDGTIKFVDGKVTVLPPDCCHCVGDDPCAGGCGNPVDPHAPGQPCNCPCHDVEGNAGYKSFDIGNNLYFGEWTIGQSGTFDSANVLPEAQGGTTSAGTHTGIQVVNMTGSTVKIGVSQDQFEFPDKTPLAGAQLTLNQAGFAVNTEFGSATQTATQLLDVNANDGVQMLTVSPGSAVKAAWSGVLDIPPGVTNQAEKALSVLTWAVIIAP